MVIHSISLPIAGLWKEKTECGQAVSEENRVRLWPGTLLACRAAGTAPVVRAPFPKTHRWPRGRPGSSVRADLHVSCSGAQFVPHVQCSTPPTLPSTLLSAPYRDPQASTMPQPRQGAKRVSWAHLHVAEVVPCVAAVPRVHQHCIESICDRIALGLRHVRADVQELRVSHVLRKGDVSGAGMAFLREQEQLCCAMSPISLSRGRALPRQRLRRRRCQDEPNFPRGEQWGMAAGLHQDHLPSCSGGRTLGQDTALAVDC